MKKKRSRAFYFKIILAIVVVALIVGLVLKLAPLMVNLATPEGQMEFKEQINSMGIGGWLMLFGLELAQILLIVLPAEPLEVLAGMCYGTLGGTLFILFAAFLTTVIIYFIIGKLGKNALYHFVSEEKLKKVENSKILQDTTRLEIIMALLFFIPGTPKDLLVYIGALLPIKPWRFIIISTFARIPSVISSTIVGDNLSVGNWQISLVVYGITFLITGIGIIFSKRKGGKETEELMKIMK